jgi:adenosylcobinamide kinase/adenosylcobinamide-phosphate guanylyltransferase
MRIQAHQKTRRGGWETVEIPVHLAKWFQIEGRQYHTVVLDCLTLWLNNLQRTGIKTRNIPALVSKLLKSTQSVSGRVVMVSNELGLGLVPGDSLSRQFRSLAGDMNQKVAAAADEAYFIVSGIPIRLK